MKKMWVRLSVAFSLVMMLATFLPIVGLFVVGLETKTSKQAIPEEFLTPAQVENPGQYSPWGFVVAPNNRVYPLAPILLSLVSANLLIGITTGLWVSRSVSKPASRLVSAVQAISKQNLSQRVPEEGSQELVDLARAINQMAGDLETAEDIRRNQLADVTHELRTPLTVLQGNLKAILDGVYALNEDEIKSLYAQAGHLGQLVNDLHLLALAEAGQLPNNPQAVNLPGLVKQVTGGFDAVDAEKRIQVTFESDGDDYTFKVDPHHIQQILDNLLFNAIKHTPCGGKISIGLKRVSEGVHLSVADTGQGIPADELPFIFDRFYRRNESRRSDTGGSGLGLTITKKIAEGMGGSIDVTSEPGKGSTFTVHLPIFSALTKKKV